MAFTSQELERRLLNDLTTVGDLVPDDDSFYEELYRALADPRWFLDDDGGHVSLSWRRAGGGVNTLRSEHGRPALALAQTGREGEVSGRVAGALAGLGWHARP